jgi:hypothetical protein
MKFIKTINKILEQDEELSPEEVQPAPEPEVRQLSPESEVLLVRLIKKALVTKIDPNDINSIETLNDINETNAKESLQTLINIMKKYSTDIDVEV